MRETRPQLEALEKLERERHPGLVEVLREEGLEEQKGSAGDDRSAEAPGRHVMMWAAVVPKVNLDRRWCLCAR